MSYNHIERAARNPKLFLAVVVAVLLFFNFNLLFNGCNQEKSSETPDTEQPEPYHDFVTSEIRDDDSGESIAEAPTAYTREVSREISVIIDVDHRGRFGLGLDVKEIRKPISSIRVALGTVPGETDISFKSFRPELGRMKYVVSPIDSFYLTVWSKWEDGTISKELMGGPYYLDTPRGFGNGSIDIKISREFDDGIRVYYEKLFELAKPEIEAIIGKAPWDQMIPVFRNDDRYVFKNSSGIIEFKNKKRPQVFIHELVHAYGLRLIMATKGQGWEFTDDTIIFEEGWAQAISYEVINRIIRKHGATEYFEEEVWSSTMDFDYSLRNQKALSSKQLRTAGGGTDISWERYETSAAVWEAMNIWHQYENNEYIYSAFKKRYYELIRENGELTNDRVLIVRILEELLPTIEGIGFRDWLAEQRVMDCEIYPGDKIYLHTTNYFGTDYSREDDWHFYETFTNGSEWSNGDQQYSDRGTPFRLNLLDRQLSGTTTPESCNCFAKARIGISSTVGDGGTRIDRQVDRYESDPDRDYVGVRVEDRTFGYLNFKAEEESLKMPAFFGLTGLDKGKLIIGKSGGTGTITVKHLKTGQECVGQMSSGIAVLDCDFVGLTDIGRGYSDPSPLEITLGPYKAFSTLGHGGRYGEMMLVPSWDVGSGCNTSGIDPEIIEYLKCIGIKM